MILEVNDHGREFTLTHRNVEKVIYPQEFLCHVSQSGHFEFVGWWNKWDLDQPLDQAAEISRPIAVLRRL